MRSILANALGRLVANDPMQRLLHFTLRANLWLMGIGAGADPNSSGERGVLGMLPMGATIIDAGANEGQFAAIALEQCDRATIHCFEPSDAAFQRLHTRFEGDVRVVMNRKGLAARSGRAALFYDRPGSVIASLYPRELGFRDISFDQSESVEVVSLDDYCDAAGIRSIDLLKMDIEGAELEALRGAVRALQRTSIVTFEFGGANVDARTYLRDFVEMLTDFRVYRLGVTGKLLTFSYDETQEQFSTTNYVAIRKNSSGENRMA